MEIVNKEVKIIKMADCKYGNNHPNGINVDYSTQGKLLNEPIVGHRLLVSGTRGNPDISTSPVTFVLDRDDYLYIQTENSIYHLYLIQGD